jgi:hypothetical protein
MKSGRKVKVHTLVLVDTNDDNADNGQHEKYQTDHREYIEIDAIFTSNITEQIGWNHSRHDNQVYIAPIFFTKCSVGGILRIVLYCVKTIYNNIG